MIENVAQYYMIQYKDLGRSKQGCDCYGLVYVMMQDIMKKELPKHDTYDSGNMFSLAGIIKSAESDWEKVQTPKKGDVAVFLLHGLPQHVGFMINCTEYLEMTRDRGVMLGSIRKAEGKHTLSYVCRYKG